MACSAYPALSARQGRLICTNSFVDCVIDFNKTESGYKTCVVGQNNLTGYDAMKAVALVKSKLKKAGKPPDTGIDLPKRRLRQLTRKVFAIKEVRFGDKTSIERGLLTPFAAELKGRLLRRRVA